MTAFSLRRYRKLLDLRCSRTARVRAAAWRAVRAGCRRAVEAVLSLLAVAVVVGLALSGWLSLPLLAAFAAVAWAVSRERELRATRRERDAAVESAYWARAAVRGVAHVNEVIADVNRCHGDSLARLDEREGAAR